MRVQNPNPYPYPHVPYPRPLGVLKPLTNPIRGEVQQPNKEVDPIGHENWKKNDNYAKHLITQNTGDESIIHIQHNSTSHVAWKNLEAIYEDKS